MKTPLFAAGSCVCAMLWLHPGGFASEPESLQAAAAEWARLRSETVRLEADWEWQRDLLTSTNAALKERVRKLEAQRDQLKARLGVGGSELDDAAARNNAASEALAVAARHLSAVTARLIQLRPMLPPRLSAALELPHRSLANPALSPGERMLYVTTVLNRCAQFNSTITYADEAVTLPGGSGQTLLSVLYWGLGGAYALDRASGRAYLGAPAAGGWQWHENPAAARAVARALAIHQEKADPDFVLLPAQLSHPAEQEKQP